MGGPTLGHDNALVSFLPGFLVLVASAFPPRLLPRAPAGSFLRGLHKGLPPDPPRQAPSPERMARILLLLARGALVASGVFLLAGGWATIWSAASASVAPVLHCLS